MKIFKTVRLKGYLKKEISQNMHVCVFALLFAVGFAAGCIFEFCNIDFFKNIADKSGIFIYATLPSLGFFSSFVKIIKILAVIVLSVTALGMFLPGQLILTVLSTAEGTLLGLCTANLYEKLGFSGFGIFSVILIVPILIFLNFQLEYMKKSFSLSFSIFRSVFYGGCVNIYKCYKEFLIYLAVMVGITMLCGLLTALDYKLFGRLFL